MIPGSNILRQALTVIAAQPVAYYQATGRTANDVGQYVTTYASPITLYGSFQPVPRSLYQIYGLDLQKSYYNFYVSKNVIDVTRNVSGDQLVFNNQRFQCESNTDWYVIDGWKGILCVMVQNSDEFDPIVGFNTEPPTNENFSFEQGGFKP